MNKEKVLQKLKIDEDYYGEFGNQFLSNSHSVMDYNIATKLTLDLVRQILYLEENGKTFSYLDPQDIIVLNNDIFLILNRGNLYDIENNKIVINKPYDISAFMSPNVKTNQVLPLKVHFTEVYYSIGVILVFCLFNVNVEERTDIRNLLYFYHY